MSRLDWGDRSRLEWAGRNTAPYVSNVTLELASEDPAKYAAIQDDLAKVSAEKVQVTMGGKMTQDKDLARLEKRLDSLIGGLVKWMEEVGEKLSGGEEREVKDQTGGGVSIDFEAINGASRAFAKAGESIGQYLKTSAMVDSKADDTWYRIWFTPPRDHPTKILFGVTESLVSAISKAIQGEMKGKRCRQDWACREDLLVQQTYWIDGIGVTRRITNMSTVHIRNTHDYLMRQFRRHGPIPLPTDATYAQYIAWKAYQNHYNGGYPLIRALRQEYERRTGIQFKVPSTAILTEKGLWRGEQE